MKSVCYRGCQRKAESTKQGEQAKEGNPGPVTWLRKVREQTEGKWRAGIRRLV